MEPADRSRSSTSTRDNGWPDVEAVRNGLIDPWSAGPRVGAARRPDRASLRDPFSQRTPSRRTPPPGTVMVAQLDLQDPFADPPPVTSAPVTRTRATLDLHDPFADGEVRWDPCRTQATVGGVAVQRPRAVQEHVEAQCTRTTGPLRDPFARPEPAAPATPPSPPPVSPPARSV